MTTSTINTTECDLGDLRVELHRLQAENTELRHQNEELRGDLVEATTCSTTGLLLRGAWRRAALHHLSADDHAAVIMCDINGFKALNDRHGHFVADEVLAVVATRLATGIGSLRPLAGRWGGDELVALLPSRTTPRTGLPAPIRAGTLAALRRSLNKKIDVVAYGITVSVSVSVGIAWNTNNGLDFALREADLDLLDAQHSAGHHVRGGPRIGPCHRTETPDEAR